jgi:hypothetical protein
MLIENIRRPFNYSLFPIGSFGQATGHVDLKKIIEKELLRQEVFYEFNEVGKITLVNHTAIRVLKRVNHIAKMKKYLLHPLTLFTITTLSAVPLFFTSALVFKIALVLINNLGLWFLMNQAAFRMSSELSNSFKIIDEATSALITALESEPENLEIQ